MNVAARLEPAPRQRLVDIAYDQIRQRIVEGLFPMGTRLIETQLASELGISRGPVRLAIQRLVEEGLVIERPHQGVVIRELDATSLVDLYNVRLGLERTAIRLATRRGMNTQVLWDLVTQMRQAAEKGNPMAVAHRELEFHTVICDSCGNKVLANIFRGLEGQLMMAIAIDDAGFENLNDIAGEHIPLIEAIEAGDEHAAALAVEQHILSTIEAAITRLGGDTGDLLNG